ncbi:glycerol-3-phosphate acyltransferase [bacterium]|nr:glycerol-3-phosphate acyltransferase [bacterium]
METILYGSGIILGAFLVGSFPTAYILVHRQHGKDLRKEGSGNVGTLNAYEVSRSRSTGVMVLLIDLLKGAFPVAVVHLAFRAGLPGDHVMLYATLALLGAVAGHNYSPWIGWKGGRGLATAAGASLLINPLLPAIWGLFWGAGFLKTRNVHFGNIAATVLLPFAVLLGESTVNAATLFADAKAGEVTLLAFLMSFLVFVRHIEPLRQMLRPIKNDQSA